VSNPLDEAFAKVGLERATAASMGREKERAAELAAGDLLKAYREVLEAVPRHVDRESETLTLAWSPRTEPPSSVQLVGPGRDHRGGSLVYGTCEAWRFTRSNPEDKSRTQFFVAVDCATLFMTKTLSSVAIKRRLRRALSATWLEAFADVRTGHHNLRLDVSPGSGEVSYRLYGSNLISPEHAATIIAEQELARRR
jgi:hypothetical protein